MSSRPVHIAKLGTHTSYGEFAASAHSAALLSHQLWPLCFHMSCGRFAAPACSNALLSRKLRPPRGLRSQQRLAEQRAAAAAWLLCSHQRFALTRAAAASRPPLTACAQKMQQISVRAKSKLRIVFCGLNFQKHNSKSHFAVLFLGSFSDPKTAAYFRVRSSARFAFQ